jgi:hypothetical protein
LGTIAERTWKDVSGVSQQLFIWLQSWLTDMPRPAVETELGTPETAPSAPAADSEGLEAALPAAGAGSADSLPVSREWAAALLVLAASNTWSPQKQHRGVGLAERRIPAQDRERPEGR